MANYLASTFISSFLSTSKTLRILSASGQISFSFSVCNYQKALVGGNNLYIVLEDNNKEYILDFDTTSEAMSALVLFKNAVDTLRQNCGEAAATVPTGSSETIINSTYAAYKAAASAHTLVPLQWYDVVDSTGVLFTAGTTLRLFATTESDVSPTGTVLNSTNAIIAINCNNDSVIRYELSAIKSTFLNSLPLNQVLSSSSNILANASNINATGSSFIESNNSVATLINCSSIRLNNSTVTLSSVSNTTFDNIQQDLSAIGFNLSGIEIDRNTSLGKTGRAEKDGSSLNLTLQAYYDTIEQNITLDTNANSMNIILDNKILQANGEFRIKWMGTGTGNIINILDKNSSNLFTLTDAQKGFWVSFKFNKTTGLFEFINIIGFQSGVPYTVSSVTNSQTIFPLPIPATNPTELEMFVNGQKQLYNLDFSYASQSVTFLNRDYSLDSNDQVDFVIY